MELGICTVYFEFISTNIAAVLHDSTVDQRRVIMMCIIPVLGGLALIRHMKTLAPLSGIANISMAASLVVVVYFSVYHIVAAPSSSSTHNSTPYANYTPGTAPGVAPDARTMVRRSVCISTLRSRMPYDPHRC
jgi:amino acid permease